MTENKRKVKILAYVPTYNFKICKNFADATIKEGGGGGMYSTYLKMFSLHASFLTTIYL